MSFLHLLEVFTEKIKNSHKEIKKEKKTVERSE